MPRHTTAMLAVAAVASLAALPTLARAATTVNVTLQDATDSGVHSMKMTATPASVKAGEVTIHASNQSMGLVHEVIVVRPPANGAALPYDSKSGRVIERQIADLGEVSDLPHGKSGSLTLHLTAGKYLLICNQPNHYKAGMWTTLTVTK